MVASAASWKQEILSTLSGTGIDGVDVKALRKMILVARQLDDDKTAKKTFKVTVQELQAENLLQVAADGQVTLVKTTIKKKKRKQKEDEDGTGSTKESNKKAKKKIEQESSTSSNKKAKKAKREMTTETASDTNDAHPHKDDEELNDYDDDDAVTAAVQKDNPSGITRLFVGNLPFKVDETSLGEFFPGLTHIKWITDMETGRFYGSAFVEMKNPNAAAVAVAKSGQNLLGRPIKVNFAPPRPGDVWPPAQKTIKGNGPDANGDESATPKKKKQATAGGTGVAAMGEKPVDCHKLFVGNLSYEIDDDAITKFFLTVDAEVKAIRWIHHQETGFFKGVYVFFHYYLRAYTCFCFAPTIMCILTPQHDALTHFL
jgi:nucleolin